MDDLTGKGLLEIVEEAGYAAASYSGRGMFGDKCIGIWFKDGDWQTTLGDIAERAALLVDAAQVGWLVRSVKVDSPVLYWPSLAWSEEFASETDESGFEVYEMAFHKPEPDEFSGETVSDWLPVLHEIATESFEEAAGRLSELTGLSITEMVYRDPGGEWEIWAETGYSEKPIDEYIERAFEIRKKC